MSGFKSYGEDDFDRVFITDSEIIDRFVGNRLWVWGSNYFTELGTNTGSGQFNTPTSPSGGGVNWSVLASSPNRAPDYSSNETPSGMAAIKSDGTLWMWGNNFWGNLGDGTTTTRSSPVTTAGGGTTWKQVALGGSQNNGYEIHATAIKTDGTLWTWGRNGSGQLGNNGTTDRSSPGTTSGGGTNWKQVTAGHQFVAAIKTDGTLWTWGDNVNGQLGTGNTTARSSPGTTAGGGTNWKQVSAGYLSTGAIKTDGTLWTWGSNLVGALGDGTTTGRSSPGTTAGGGTNWKQICVGVAAMAAIKTDGTLWTWGYNITGRLGSGSNSDRSSPGTTAGGGTNWKQVSLGGYIRGSAAAIKTDGTLWTWGDNYRGQLGNNTFGGGTSRSSPGTTVSNNTRWKSVQMIAGACMALSEP